jgi:hypothetical protein
LRHFSAPLKSRLSASQKSVSKSGIENRPGECQNWVKETTIQTFDSLKGMKADEYRYWQGRPVHERMDAVSEITLTTYAMKEALPDVPRLQRTVSVLPRPQR